MNKAGPIHGLQRRHDPRPIGNAVAQPIGLAEELGRDFQFRLADPDAVPHFHAETLQQHAIHNHTARQRLTRIAIAFELQFADKRIGTVDTLQLDQRLVLAIETAAHGAHRCRLARAANGIDPCALIR